MTSIPSVTSNRKRGRFVLIAGAAILLYMAVGGILRKTAGSEGTKTAFTPAAERRPFTPLQGATIPERAPWQLASLRGKVVLLNYAATWCAPCLRETPDLVATRTRYSERGFEIVGLMMDEGSPSSVNVSIRQYAEQYKINYPLVRPVDDPLLLFTGLGLPTSILLDRQGRQVRSYLGPVSQATLSADIEQLLQEEDLPQAAPAPLKS